MEYLSEKQIRAVYDDNFVRVYQAYPNNIADTAISKGKFVSPPFKIERMTWIKPSFLWMMYRSAWAQKDSGQCRILAIDVTLSGFEWALKNSVQSHKPHDIKNDEWQQLKATTLVRIQWDPERDIHLNPLSHRTIQIGLSNEAVLHYTQEWIIRLTDITDEVLTLKSLINKGELDKAKSLLPVERHYPISNEIAEKIGATT